MAVVCSIGLDHVDWLGKTLDEIGREKAGIFRRGRPAVLGSTELPGSVWRAIEETGARAVVPGRDYHAKPKIADWDFDYGDLSLRNLPNPSLTGVNQIANAATALAALKNLDMTLTHDLVSEALRRVRLPVRFQRVHAESGHGPIEWVFDVAHNVPAAQGLAQNLRALPRARVIAVCGILGDKDIPEIVAAVEGQVDAWIPVGLAGSRAVSAEELALYLPDGAKILAHASDVVAACRLARDAARTGDRVLVFGSFLTVGPALEFLGPEFVGL